MDERSVPSDPGADDTANEWPQAIFWRVLRLVIAMFALLDLLIAYFELFQPGLREFMHPDLARGNPMSIMIFVVVVLVAQGYFSDRHARQARTLAELESLPLMCLVASMGAAVWPFAAYFSGSPIGWVVLAMVLSVAYLFLVVRWTVRMGPRALSLPVGEPTKRCRS